MTVAYLEKDPTSMKDRVRVVTKGAPEKVIRMCSYELDDCHKPVDFNGMGEAGSSYLNETVYEMAA